MQQPKEERNFALLPKHIQNQTQNLFFKVLKIKLQTQKWVPKNSSHLTRNGVVSSFLNPQWLEGKPQTSKQQQQQKLRKERQVPKETLLEEKRGAYESKEENFRYPPGITRPKKHVPVMFWGQFLSFFPPNFGNYCEFLFFLKKCVCIYIYIYPTMFGNFWEIFSSFFVF